MTSRKFQFLLPRPTHRRRWRKATRRHAVRFVPLRFQRLEERTLLATVAWAADHDGFWDDGANWSTGSVPAPGDDVMIDRSTSLTVTIGPDDSLTAHNLQSSATLSIAGTGSSLVLGGGFVNTGTVNISAGMLALGGDLTNSGTVTIGGGTLDMNNHGIANQSGGLIDVLEAPHLTELGSVTNAGTFRDADSLAVMTINCPFNNQGGTKQVASTTSRAMETSSATVLLSVSAPCAHRPAPSRPASINRSAAWAERSMSRRAP
jgi:hypothetical protein